MSNIIRDDVTRLEGKEAKTANKKIQAAHPDCDIDDSSPVFVVQKRVEGE